MMMCPFCNHIHTKVLDSRSANENRSIRRRRECESCGRRFTTFETLEEIPLMVIKKDGSREEFSRDKVLRGLLRACEKRQVTTDQLEAIVARVENDLRSEARSEVESTKIGEFLMQQLFEVDEVSYVRFASVYRQFKDINVFIEVLNGLLRKTPGITETPDKKNKK
jgi:transcriptional repressor NrdR